MIIELITTSKRTNSILKPYNEKRIRYKLRKVGWSPEVIDKYIKTLNRDNKQFILDVINKENK